VILSARPSSHEPTVTVLPIFKIKHGKPEQWPGIICDSCRDSVMNEVSMLRFVERVFIHDSTIAPASLVHQ
jgi:hypothetical protein